MRKVIKNGLAGILAICLALFGIFAISPKVGYDLTMKYSGGSLEDLILSGDSHLCETAKSKITEMKNVDKFELVPFFHRILSYGKVALKRNGFVHPINVLWGGGESLLPIRVDTCFFQALEAMGSTARKVLFLMLRDDNFMIGIKAHTGFKGTVFKLLRTDPQKMSLLDPLLAHTDEEIRGHGVELLSSLGKRSMPYLVKTIRRDLPGDIEKNIERENELLLDLLSKAADELRPKEIQAFFDSKREKTTKALLLMTVRNVYERKRIKELKTGL